MHFRHLARYVWFFCALGACAVSTPRVSNRGTPPASGAGGTGATPGNNAGFAGSSSDNPTGVLQTPDASQAMPTTPTTPTTMTTLPPGPVSIDQTGSDNPAGLSDADVKTLVVGGAPGSMKWLYPYDGTVFPRGMIAPVLMWDGPVADAVYLHIKAKAFDYKGVLKAASGATSAPQLQVPQDVWDKAGLKTGGKTDTFLMELTARASAGVTGPIVSHFTIAQATVKGSIYYNTYASALPGAAVGGNVLRIPAGGKAELFLSTGCNGCHSVAANGSRMISETALVIGGSSYQLAANGAANPMGVPVGPRTSFGAMYPDGSKYLSTSVAVEVARAKLAQGLGAPDDATLYDTTSGQVVPDTAVPPGALMPMFSPDGTKLVFNDFAIEKAHGLAVMDYDVKANKAGNYKMLMKEADTSGNTRPGWPFFLPDGKAVLFVRTDGGDFSGGGAGIGGITILAPNSDMYITDLATGTMTILAQAMGYNTPANAATNTTYLPFAADDLHHSYFPTVSPVAAGGYFWIFFDAVRHYGNLGVQRQLWGAAIDIQADGSYKLDPSHPAFYLPGQEFGTGNHRAFAALDPCKKDGDSCSSGIDCCGGTCYFATATELVDPVGSCSPPPVNSCAKKDERCSATSDCCAPTGSDPQTSCIAGFCAVILLN